MKRTLLTLALSLLGLSAAHAVAPANDAITKAVVFTGSYQHLVTPDVSTATAAATDPLDNGVSFGKTIWYRLLSSASETGYSRIQIKALSGTGSYALYEAVDRQNPLTSLRKLQSAAIAGAVVYYVSNPNDVYLMIAGTGTFDLTRWLARDNNYFDDFPSSAIQLSGDHGTVVASNIYDTLSADEPVFPISMVNTRWYQWTPNASVNAFVDTSFSYISNTTGGSQANFLVHDTVLAVYKGTPDALTLVTSDDDSGWRGTNSRVSFPATSGVTYYIAVGTKTGQTPGEFQLHYYLSTTNPEFSFAPGSTRSIDEDGGVKSFSVRRIYAGEIFNTVLVSTVAGGTGVAGTDFTAITNQMLSFAFPSTGDGGWEQKVNFTPLDDFNDEGNLTAILKLSGATNGAVIATPNTATVTIVDDESSQSSGAGYEVELPVVRVRESDATGAGIRFNSVARKTQSGDSITLIQSVQSQSDTATYGEDFYLYSADIAAGENRAMLFGQVYDDKVFEGDEEADVVLNLSSGESFYYTLIIEDDDPYVPVPGKLVAGLSDGARRALVYATVSGTGAVSGKLTLLGQVLSWKAQLSERGRASIPLLPKGRTTGLVLTLQATDANGGFKVSLDDPFMGAQTSQKVVIQNYSATVNPCPEAARYTFVGGSAGSAFECTSAGSLVVSTAGTATFSGKLFDGTAFTAAGYVDGSGQVFAQAALYNNLGHTFWTGSLPESANQVVTVNTGILRPGREGDTTKLGARNLFTSTTICRYSPPTTGQRALESWSTGSGKATLTSPVMTMLTKTFTISTANAFTVPADANQLKLALTPATGIFTGSFIPTGGTKALPIYGALIDLPLLTGYGQGFFFNGFNSGRIFLLQP